MSIENPYLDGMRETNVRFGSTYAVYKSANRRMVVSGLDVPDIFNIGHEMCSSDTPSRERQQRQVLRRKLNN